MKKILMTLAAAFVAVTMSAQIYVGGGIGFSSSKYRGGDNQTAYKILPEIGYNIDETLAVGVQLGYQQGYVMSYNAVDKEKTLTISPYLRYNALKFDKLTVFGDLNVLYENEDYDGAKSTTIGVGIKPGIAIALNDKFTFVSHLGFLGYKQEKEDDVDASSAIGFSASNGVGFALYYNF